MKREEWEYISHQHRKQNRSHHNSNVYFDGVPLGRSRLTRALQRYQPDISLARKFGRGRSFTQYINSSPPAELISITAPSPELRNGHLVRLASSQSFQLSIDWPDSLPWLQFERRFTISKYIQHFAYVSRIPRVQMLIHGPALPQSTKLIHLLARAAQNLGLMRAMENKTSFDFARAIYIASRETPSGAVDLARMLHESWRSAMPSDSPNSGGVAAQMLKMILFQISNKSCRARHVPSRYSSGHGYSTDITGRGDHLLVLFYELHKTHPTVLEQLLTWTDPTSEAITESLYDDAVRYGNTALVSTLLCAGRDVNARLDLGTSQKVNRSNGRLHMHVGSSVLLITPLQWAASVCDIKLASLLIDAGANINLGDPSPLTILCSTTKPSDADVLRFADLLVHHGARVNMPNDAHICPLMGAVASGNKDLIRFLLRHGAKDVVKWCAPFETTKLIHDLLLTKDHKLAFPGGFCQYDPMSALQSSIVVNNSSITDMLIRSVSNQQDRNEILERALVSACVAGEKDLVRRLLVHLQAHFYDNINLINEIVLATAWDMDCEIANFLLDHGVMQRELRNLSVAFFQAAALHGNISLIKLLKSRRFDVNSGAKLQFRVLARKNHEECQPSPLTSTPIGCAVWMNHKEAIETLLAIGADVAEIHLVCAIQSGSQSLLSQVLDSCDDVDEPWDGKRALDVAIRYRRGIVLIRRLVDAGAVLHGHELVDAVRSDDQGVVCFLLPKCGILETNKDGENVLEAACRTGNLEMVQYYFACGGAYSSRAMMLAASRAVKTHDYRVIESLVTGRPSRPVDEHEASSLALSIRMGDTVLVNIFLNDPFRSSLALTIYRCCNERKRRSGVRLGLKDCVHPLDYENQHNDIQVLFEYVCLQGPECYHRFSPMLVASLMGQRQLVKAMLSRGYLPDALLVEMSYDESDICKDIRDEVVAACISLIPLVENPYWHECLLTVAAKCSHIDIGIVQQHLKKLKSLYPCHKECDISRGSDLGGHKYENLWLEAGAGARSRQPSLSGETFIFTILCSRLDLASLLLDHGADINAHQSEALQRAIRRRDFGAVVFLLEKGIDVNVPGLEGQTPLELAAAVGMIDTVQLLLTRGVDIQGRMRIHLIRAVTFAIQNCHYATAKLLKEHNCWTDEDQNLAKTPRGSERYWDYCPRFLYDDPSLEACKRCLEKSETSSSSSSSEDDERTHSNADLMPVTEQLEDPEVGPLTDELSILDLESEMMEEGQAAGMCDWPLVPYGPQDRELDDIVRGLLLQDGMIIDLE